MRAVGCDDIASGWPRSFDLAVVGSVRCGFTTFGRGRSTGGMIRRAGERRMGNARVGGQADVASVEKG